MMGRRHDAMTYQPILQELREALRYRILEKRAISFLTPIIIDCPLLAIGYAARLRRNADCQLRERNSISAALSPARAR